ncbi:unnamed protein product [Lathyrus sativus]|nr:unnamed protein product [Lathyrus sativus]
MEYLNRLLSKMQHNHNFNHHAKCEKVKITNLDFADDVLLFAMADCKSVELMMEALDLFSKSTVLIVNPRKCKVYFGGVDDDIRNQIISLIGFEQGTFPFRYLGVPLSSKKLNIHHYMSLIYKVVGKIKALEHLASRLCIKYVSFVMANYWM